MPTAPDVLDLRMLAARAAHDGVKRAGGFLDYDRLEDLVSYLSVIAVRYDARYDPAFGQARSTFIYRVLRRRVTDWYRKELGDSRYRARPRPLMVPLSEQDADPDEFDIDTKLMSRQRVARWTAAAEAAGLTREQWLVRVLDDAAARALDRNPVAA